MTLIYTQAPLHSLHERSSVFDQKREQYTPRESQHTNTNSSYYSNSQQEGNGWKTKQPLSPMSDSKKGLYEVSPVNGGDMYQTRPEAAQKPAREQLPPLSSLFGSTSHQN